MLLTVRFGRPDLARRDFVSDTVIAANGRDLCPGGFRYNTLVSGNSNKGHLYGTTLSDADKDALIEFMKTL